MRHRKSRLQLNRFTSWRKSTLLSLARSVLIHQSIKTTKLKAQGVKPLIERLISLAKLNTLAAKRQAYKILGDHRLVNLLFAETGSRFNNRIGGYTRMYNLGRRRGDNAKLVILELSEIKKEKIKKPKQEKEIKPEEEIKPKETTTELAVKEKPPIKQKPAKKFLGGLRKIFKKERDSL